MAKPILAKIRDGAALAKFHFDIGNSFLVFLNFSLLVVTASSKFQAVWNVPTLVIWIIAVPVAFAGTWLFGYILDKYVKYQDAYYKAANDRVPQTMEIVNLSRDIQARLDRIEKKMGEK